MRTFEELTLHTRRQASRGASLNTFGVNIAQDLLRAVTGKPRDEAFARRVSGADAVVLSASLRFDELGHKCAELLEAYSSERYRRDFGFVDQIQKIADPEVAEELNRMLIERLQTGDLSLIHLAPPEPVEWEAIEGFTYSTEHHRAVHDDLEVDDLLATLNNRWPLSLSRLRRHRIGVKYHSVEQPIEKWTLYDAIVAEIVRDRQVYVLSGGHWFEVHERFADRVNAIVSNLGSKTFRLLPARKGEHEPIYNERVCSSNGYVLMHGRKAMPAEGTQIELCDILTPDGKLIHVKRRSRSATLSHLFNQGVVSAEALVYDEAFRSQVREIVAQLDPETAKLIPAERPNPSRYEVVFAIIGRRAGNWPLSSLLQPTEPQEQCRSPTTLGLSRFCSSN